MLVAAIRSGSPLAGKALVFNESDSSFEVTGVGPISATELLDYEDRRLLEWADQVTREWALETADFQARAAATRAREAAAREAEARVAAEAAAAELDRVAPKPVIYDPPSTAPVLPGGIPAKAPGFALDPVSGRAPGRRIVFAEAPPDDEIAGARAPVSPQPAPRPAVAQQAPAAAEPTLVYEAPAWSPPGPGEHRDGSDRRDESPQRHPETALAWDEAAGQSAVVGRRADRRGAQKAAEHRREMAGARLRIAIYVAVAAVVAVVLVLLQRGGL
jgi:hypothetical protein